MEKCWQQVVSVAVDSTNYWQHVVSVAVDSTKCWQHVVSVAVDSTKLPSALAVVLNVRFKHNRSCSDWSSAEIGKFSVHIYAYNPYWKGNALSNVALWKP